jgi:hypothetical protein
MAEEAEVVAAVVGDMVHLVGVGLVVEEEEGQLMDIVHVVDCFVCIFYTLYLISISIIKCFCNLSVVVMVEVDQVEVVEGEINTREGAEDVLGDISFGGIQDRLIGREIRKTTPAKLL